MEDGELPLFLHRLFLFKNLETMRFRSDYLLLIVGMGVLGIIRHDRYTVYNMRRRGFTMEADALQEQHMLMKNILICYGSSAQTQQLSTPAVGGLPMTQQHGSPTVGGLAMSQQMHHPSRLNVAQHRHGSPVVGSLPMNLQMHPSPRLNMPQPSFAYRHGSLAASGLAMSQQMHHSTHLHLAPLPQLSLAYRQRSLAVGELPMNQQVHRPNVTPYPQQSVVPITSMDPGTVSRPSKREVGSSSRTPSSHEESGN